MAEPTTQDKCRVELLSDARVLIAWLEANPDVPVRTVDLRFSVLIDDDKDGIEEIGRIARAAGTRVTENGSHHEVHATFGHATYQATYIESDRRRLYRDHMRTYPADTATATAPVAEHCVCCTYDCGDRRGHVLDERQFVTPELCVCGDYWPCERAS